MPGGDPIAELIARMRRIGLDPDAGQLADALWLARWSRPTGTVPDERGTPSPDPAAPPGDGPGPVRADSPDAGSRDGGPRDGGPRDGGPRDGGPRDAGSRDPGRPLPGDLPPPGGGAAPGDGPTPAGGTGADRRVALYPVPRDGAPRGGPRGRAAELPLGVPAAPALPSPLELQRALRPLQGYRTAAPPLRTTLDETATAELSARAGGLVLPVFRGVTRADAALQLVMDASSSMRVWDRMFTELEQVFAQLGAFWGVEVSHLHQGPDGEPAVSRSPEPGAAPLHSADRLSDPTGRRVTLLVSDCAGPLWHSGRAHRLLHHLSRLGPVAVLQPLPQRMWNRTRLPVSYGRLTRGEALAGAATLTVRLPAGTPPEARAGALPVPVLPPEPAALGAWARLLSGAGAGPVAGAVGWVRHDHGPAQGPRAGRRLSGLELVSRFRSNASKTAGRLAGYLAAAPLSLPVMQLVQRTMLPGSGPSELAEVLLSGLVSRAKAEDHGEDGAQWYEFAPGVQEALLSPLGRDEAMLVLKHCSEYIEYRFGRGGPNFPALALAQLGDGGSGRPHPPGTGYPGDPTGGADSGGNGDNGAATLVPQPFAEVAARVLERFMPLPEQFALYGGRGRDDLPGERPTHAAVLRARALAGRFDSDGMVQDLIDAVQLLRGATEHELPAGTDPELWAEYATCVLRLWEVQGGADLLREAETAAERAVAHPRALRERAALARVLHAAATDRRRR
ncbi:SAV_2336 N-terminal domain-related protein [Streptomyces sp. NPDC007084]|uniref:SAV_2336 N-terminal domain-related protein n=1 Tax=Streptomyces sp. NPDC007084 TaxID=3154313 RepID=UPI003454EF13